MHKRNRPLSPHLQIYKPQITSVLSIFHRMAGVGLAIGGVGVVAFLWALMMGPEAFASVKEFMAHPFMQVILAGFVVTLCFYFYGVIRHLYWDIGKGFEIRSVYISGWLLIAATIVTSALILMVILC